MPPEETRASVRRLVELGYLDTVGPAEIEAVTAQDIAVHVCD
ncbi:hypothetical protein FHS41_008251 [Streptomyces violarus]|uniref:Uncharacterized protein n=1 Tax=Streptomyces violarus TaxID=67380 RepID=A0A7W5F6I1_9ACTN|nr:hypothetical protein [Streptomyces violarus]MBB3081693.1 hypothetical protein [Streptomyces violarus]